MTREFNRRDFTRRTTVGMSGLLTGSLLTGSLLSDGRWGGPQLLGGRALGQEPENASRRLVLLGLNALARAHELDYFADGHRGAAFIAAHLLCVENSLDVQATARIVELFELNWSSTPLCKPFPDTEPKPERIQDIGFALAEGGDVLRQVGHNAIFAMLAIKAFRMLPEAATPERIDGVCKLIRSFTPWRDIEPAPDVSPPPFSDSAAASEFILREASDAIDRFVGFGQGFAGHMLTFGQSLVELAAMGDEEWAESCRKAFCKYVTVTRLGPEADSRPIADHKPSPLRPNAADYWKQRDNRSVGIGHVFKYPYSYYDLLRRANHQDLQQTLEEKAFAIF